MAPFFDTDLPHPSSPGGAFEALAWLLAMGSRQGGPERARVLLLTGLAFTAAAFFCYLEGGSEIVIEAL